REHIKEYLHHLSMSQASLAELETQLEIAVRLKYLSSEQFNEALERIASIGRQLYALRPDERVSPGTRHLKPYTRL
ncbi:MAG: four helix bundle protein, partial [Acidobacteriota bacterium]|nr:four helix bundle protein [Acidobacteriota bacterium]